MVKAGCLRISCQTLVENISVYRLQSQREKLFVITPVLGVYMIFLGSHGSSCRDYIYIYMLFGKKYVLCIYIYIHCRHGLPYYLGHSQAFHIFVVCSCNVQTPRVWAPQIRAES